MQTGGNGKSEAEKKGVENPPQPQPQPQPPPPPPPESRPATSNTPKIKCTVGEAIVDALLRGSNVQQIANKLTNGSILKVLKIVSDEVAIEEIDAVCKVSEAVRWLQLEQIKTRAIRELSEIAQGCYMDDGGLSTDEARAVEIQRRVCVSILRLNAYPSRRDSYQDERGPSLLRYENHRGTEGTEGGSRFDLFGDSALRAADGGTQRATTVSERLGDEGNEKTQKRENAEREEEETLAVPRATGSAVPRGGDSLGSEKKNDVPHEECGRIVAHGGNSHSKSVNGAVVPGVGACSSHPP